VLFERGRIELADKLSKIAATLKNKGEPPSITTREFLWWFGAQRRGYVVVWRIRDALKSAGLITIPDFESAYIDAPISFELYDYKKAEREKPKDDEPESTDVSSEAAEGELVRHDPTYRVSKLAAANQGVLAVKPDSTIEHVVTLMLERDFSQVPVMTTDREVKGVVSWGAIGAKIALSDKKKSARDYMEKAYEVRHSDSMFDVIQTVVVKDSVLVRAEDGRISGIITASDLSVQFRQLSEPFLLLSEIENLLRLMIDGRFNLEELKGCANEGDTSRDVSGVADLNFGEYIRLLENPERWEKFGVAIDRTTFCKGLDDVRRIRNEVMHFDPDGVPPSDLERLRDYTRFLSRLRVLIG
jgi:CBS domain-containing protein